MGRIETQLRVQSLPMNVRRQGNDAQGMFNVQRDPMEVSIQPYAHIWNRMKFI